MCRRRKSKKYAKKKRKEKQRHLKSLMYSLVTETTADGKLPAELIQESKDICIVVTDLENSTAQAEKDPKAFLRIQEIHDTVSPDELAKALVRKQGILLSRAT